MPLIEVLRWNAAPSVFAFRYPNCELTTKSQLVVSESQEAVLVKEGQFVGPFGPGRHTLDTRNYPVLTKWVTRLVSGGESPYTAEVWFTNKAIPLNIKWGTTDPIQVEDPKYHIMLPVRAFGQYGVQISNSQKFLAKLVGRLPVFVEKTLSEYFRGVIVTRAKDCVASYLVDQGVSVLQISSRLNAISHYLEEQLTSELDDYGLRVVSFTVNSISTDEKDSAVSRLKEALAKKAEMDIVGYTYQQEKSFDVMGKAAGNEGGGVGASLMGAGMGLGMGMGFGVPMGGAANTIAQNLQMSPPPSTSEGKCPKCGAVVVHGSKFCGECGQILQKTCPECHAPVPEGVKFCPECGHKMVSHCPSCNLEVPPGTKFCPECGTKIS